MPFASGELMFIGLLMVGSAVWCWAIAHDRGVEPGIWVMAGLLLGFIGVILTYAVAKPEARTADAAPAAAPVVPAAWSAPAPGVAATTSTGEYCPRCGTARVGAFRFCRGCQLDLDAI